MKILHVPHFFVPCREAGGVVNAVYEISKKQVETGNHVTVFTTDSCSERIQLDNRFNVDVDGIKTYYFKNISNTLKWKTMVDTPAEAKSFFKKELKNFDIIHIHEHRHTLAILAHHYAVKYDIPYVVQSHGSVLPFFQKESLKKVFDKVWGYNILKDADKLFAASDVEAKQYIKMGARRNQIEIVPMGVNLDEYSELPVKCNFRKKYNISGSDKVILFLGRLHKIKGLDLLLKSFKLLKGDFDSSLKLVIVGPDSEFKDELVDLANNLNISNDIIFTGALFGLDKLEAFTDCDIFVLPSQYESFGISALEAMMSGKAIVITDKNHISSIVDNNVGLVAKYDSKSLSKAMFKLLINDNLRNSLGKHGQELINTKYNWNVIGKQILDIYNNNNNKNTNNNNVNKDNGSNSNSNCDNNKNTNDNNVNNGNGSNSN
ncbi:MAG: glycosyltransferase [Methanobacteriaceae archaeon]